MASKKNEKVRKIDPTYTVFMSIMYYLNDYVLLSKACDRLPEKNRCSQQILARERSLRA